MKKKFISLVLSATLILGSAVPALAAEKTVTKNIPQERVTVETSIFDDTEEELYEQYADKLFSLDKSMGISLLNLSNETLAGDRLTGQDLFAYRELKKVLRKQLTESATQLLLK